MVKCCLGASFKNKERFQGDSMKLMIASDIHGSYRYCEKLVEAYKQEKAERLLLLGDLLYHGPRNDLPEEYQPKKVIELLNGIKEEILCVRGNCDTEVDQMVLEFPIMAEYCILDWQGRMVFATHGHHFNESQLPMLKKGDILLHGHTHIPVCREQETYTYLNPGSVSIPKEGSCHSYIVAEDGLLCWKDLKDTGHTYMEFQL